MKRLLQFLILVPVAVVATAFAVANRHYVSISFDPFSGEVGAGQVSAPLYVVLILAMMCGVVLGGTVTWLAQGRYRRALREARSETARWRKRAETQNSMPQTPGQTSSAKYTPARREAAANASTRLLTHN